MTAQDQRLVAALLRCAAVSGMHTILRELAPLGRLATATWVAFYRAGCDAAAAAAALEGGDGSEPAEVHEFVDAVLESEHVGPDSMLRKVATEVARLRAELANRNIEIFGYQRDLADAHEFIRLSSTRAVAS